MYVCFPISAGEPPNPLQPSGRGASQVKQNMKLILNIAFQAFETGYQRTVVFFTLACLLE